MGIGFLNGAMAGRGESPTNQLVLGAGATVKDANGKPIPVPIIATLGPLLGPAPQWHLDFTGLLTPSFDPLNAQPSASGFALGNPTAVALSASPLAFSADASGSGTTISRDGNTVVGYVDNGPLTPYHAFRRTAATGVVDLGTLDSPNNATRSSFAQHVSSDGSVVVGYSDMTAQGAIIHAFRWTQSTGMADLGSGTGANGSSRAFGVIGDGSVVVGESDFPGGFSGTLRQAFRWTSTGGFQRLGAVEADFPSTANAITADGTVVVGMSGISVRMGNTFTSGSRAFRWTQAGGLQNLGALPGHTFSAATAVSDDGRIVVGISSSNIIDRNGVGGLFRYDTNPSNSRAFYWTAQTGMRDLNELFTAAGIDLGGRTILGATGLSPDGVFLNLIVTTSTPNVTRSAIASLTFTPAPPTTQAAGKIVNLAARAQVGAGADALFCGFVISPGAEKTVLVRAVGPTLGAAPFGVPGVLADPILTLFGPDSSTRVAATNDNWNAADAATFAATGAFALQSGGRDAAIVARLAPGSYTAQVSGANNGVGLALVEVYDADPPATSSAASSRLINTAVRAQVGTDANALIPGLVISGSVAKTVLVRAVGPTLGAAPFNVPGVLAEPVVTLFSGSQSIATNRAWGTASNAAAIRDSSRAVGAFAMTEGGRDSALLVSLAPGPYTIQVTGANNTTGVALVEVYEVP